MVRTKEQNRERFRQHQAKLRHIKEMKKQARGEQAGWTFVADPAWEPASNQGEVRRDSFEHDNPRAPAGFKRRPRLRGPEATRDRRERRRRQMEREKLQLEQNRLGGYIVHSQDSSIHHANRVTHTAQNATLYRQSWEANGSDHESKNSQIQSQPPQSYQRLYETGPFTPPPGAKTIDEVLENARSQLTRILPYTALEEYKAQYSSSGQRQSYIPSPNDSFSSTGSAPVIIVDIRPSQQRALHGEITGSNVFFIGRNVLEWRLDPRADSRLDIANRYDLRVLVLCQEGYTSSLAATALHELGLSRATDIEGGFKAWKEGGLPLVLD